MDAYITWLILFGVIVIMGQLLQKTAVPSGLILVITGMFLSFVPFFPVIEPNPELVLNIFLPLLIYQISAFSSWQDMKKQLRPIALLSIGHVIFITALVAVIMHGLIPDIGWPACFVLGAIISPPDSVAIVSIAEKIRIPERVFIILEGEGMFNDATALTIFRFALAAALFHQLSVWHALGSFSLILAGEIVYGLVLGHLIGMLRTRMKNTSLHVITSLLTPFLAYIPVVKMGGSGVIATAITGFIVGNQYSVYFTPGYRLTAFSMWPMFGFIIQSLIFLLVGLDLRSVLSHISTIPSLVLIKYVIVLTLAVIVGRFIWVYGFVIALPKMLNTFFGKKEPCPSWKYPFMISWSGIRGGISLAAALAIPTFTLMVHEGDLRDLFVFLVLAIIFVTLILQGLSLPYVLKKLGIDKIGQSERYNEHLAELKARVKMINAALHWMHQQKSQAGDDKKLLNELSLHISEYHLMKNKLESRILDHDHAVVHDEEKENLENVSLLRQIVEIEKAELLKLWHANKMNIRMRNKLMESLDHQIERHVI